MHSNTVVIVTYFDTRAILSFLINYDFILYVAVVKRVVLVALNTAFRSPLLFLLILLLSFGPDNFNPGKVSLNP